MGKFIVIKRSKKSALFFKLIWNKLSELVVISVYETDCVYGLCLVCPVESDDI